MLRSLFSRSLAPLTTVSLLMLTTLPSQSLERAKAPSHQPSRQGSSELAQGIFDPVDRPNPTATIGGGARFIPPQNQPGMEQISPTRGRGNCSRDQKSSQPTVEQQLKPLLPQGIALTVAERPTVLVFVPGTSAEKITFLLQDAQGNLVYELSVPSTQTPRILNFTLPEIVPGLNVGEDYRWFISLDCGLSEPSGNPVKAGFIRRVLPEKLIRGDVPKTVSLSAVEIYAQSGIWYDAVSNLAMLRRAAPSDRDLSQAWAELLQSVGLERYADFLVPTQATVTPPPLR